MKFVLIYLLASLCATFFMARILAFCSKDDKDDEE